MSDVQVALSPIHEIIEDIRTGKMVILVDDEDRENEGDLIFAAQFATPENINFMAKQARGLICLALTEERCQKLNLGLMVQDNRAPHKTAFTVSIEAAEGVTTGISAYDRAHTVKTAVAQDAEPSDLVQPGHIFPLIAKNGGVLVRAGHTEAGCDLTRLAGLEPAAVICEIMKDDGSMARLPDLIAFARKHDLRVGTIRDLIHFRSAMEKLVERVAEKDIVTQQGTFRLCAFSDKVSGEVHLALQYGQIQADKEVLVRVHEPVSVLDFFDTGSTRHTYGITEAMTKIAEYGCGVLVMLRRAELPQEILAAMGVVQGVAQPAEKWDPRAFGIGAQILRDLGVSKMRVLANPRRLPSMSGFGLEITGYVTKH